MPILRFTNIGAFETKLTSDIGAPSNIIAKCISATGRKMRKDQIIKMWNVSMAVNPDWRLQEYIGQFCRFHKLDMKVEFYDRLTGQRLNKNRGLRSFLKVPITSKRPL